MKTFSLIALTLLATSSFAYADESLANVDALSLDAAPITAPTEDLIASKDIFPNDPSDEVATFPEDTDDKPSSKSDSSKNKKKKTSSKQHD